MAQKTQCRLVGLSCFRREDGEGFDVYCDDLNDPELYDRDIELQLLHSIKRLNR
jgi:KDO2-lipid IV(A) lauroyltransferase